jgi:dolichyl-phosphate-mannose--protein O-mannosyl transferase
VELAFVFGYFFLAHPAGVSIALTTSVKFVGLFTVALIGCSTIRELWDLACDYRISLVFIQFFIIILVYLDSSYHGSIHLSCFGADFYLPFYFPHPL